MKGGYAMTYQQRGDYRLADKLKKEFHGRGADLNGMQASSTSELMRRAGMGGDPRVNCSEEAFRENYVNREQERRGTHRADTQKQYGSKQSVYAQRSGSATRSYGRPQSRNASHSRRRTSTRREYAEEKITPAVELKVKGRVLSPLFVAALLLGTVMVMFLVFNISEVYKMTNEISGLESQLAELEAAAEQLELKLEDKNDIREIEKIATSKLGMVKEDAIQRRYISLSEGEHIDIIEDTTQKDAQDGVLLSSIFSSLGKFFERFN